MYLNIGKDMAVRTRTIVGIFDLDNTTLSPRTRAFLKKAQENGEVIACDDLPKSYIVTREFGMTRIYESAMTVQTLEKRIKSEL